MANDVIVVVQRDSLPKAKESLDILLVSTAGAHPVEVYRDIESVEAVFGPKGASPNAKIVRKATTLFNQEKTTLAPALVSKFKIVGFDTPQTASAKAATLKITLPDENLEQAIEASTNLWAKIGKGSEEAVQLTTTARVTKWSQVAALFKSTTFTKGETSYSATASSNTVTYTASATGVVDPVAEKIEFFSDSTLKKKLECKAVVEFRNGSKELTAADALVKTIKDFQDKTDNDWYFLMTDRDEDEYVTALCKYAEASEPTEAELSAGIADHRKFYMGQTANKRFESRTARAAVIYTDTEFLKEEVDASYAGNVAPFYPKSVTWKFKRPQDGNAPASAGAKLISLPRLTEGEKNKLIENHVNFLTEEYKHQYVKDGTCLNGEFIDVVLGGDWVANRMRNLLYKILLENDNIDYDDAGFGAVSTAVVQALEEATDLGIIAKDAESKKGIYTVNIPKYDDSTEDQRRNRELPEIRWDALLAGSVHQVKTKGALRATL